MSALTDRFQRKIEYLRLSVTDRCNLRCKYCMPAEGIRHIPHDEIMRFEEYLRIIQILIPLGIHKVRITGGEPTVRHGVVDFIQNLSELPGLTDLAMTTNGILLKTLARPLKEAGLDRLNISLDSLKPDRFREITRGGVLGEVLSGIEESLLVGFQPVKINVVLQKGFNTDEISDFARMTLEKPLHIRFIEFMSREAAEESRFFSNEATLEVLRELGRLEPVSDESGAGPASYYQYAGAPGKIGLISPISHKFCATCNRIRLTSEGRLILCLGSPEFLDVKRLLREGIGDEELREQIVHAIQGKPSGHEFGSSGIAREMSSIGG